MINIDKVKEALNELKLSEKFNDTGYNNCMQILEYLCNGHKIVDFQFYDGYIYKRSSKLIKKDLNNLLDAGIIEENNGDYIINKYYTN